MMEKMGAKKSSNINNRAAQALSKLPHEISTNLLPQGWTPDCFLVEINIYPLVLSHFRLVVSLIPRISPQRRTHQNPEELSEETDRDVLDERTRAQNALASDNEEEVKRN